MCRWVRLITSGRDLRSNSNSKYPLSRARWAALTNPSRFDLRAKLKKEASAGDDPPDEGTPVAGVASARRLLRRELERWREMQRVIMPSIDFGESDDCDGDDAGAGAITDVEDGDDDDGDDASSGCPEEEPLALPSDFSAHERHELGLDPLAVFERRIRVGHAYDLLDAVKQSINHQGAFLVDKRKHARGQKDNTRSQKQVSDAAARTRLLARLYNFNRDRLIALSDGEPSDVLRSINLKDDLKSKNWRAPRQQGDSREECAWIWTAVPPWTSSAEADAWQLEGELHSSERTRTNVLLRSGSRSVVPRSRGPDASAGRNQQASCRVQEGMPRFRGLSCSLGGSYRGPWPQSRREGLCEEES